MTWALAAGLIGLALLDSMSIGTLYVPIWLLLTLPASGAPRVLIYLATLAGFYGMVGLAILLGADAVIGAMGLGGLPRVPLAIGLGVAGLVLVVLGLRRRRPGGESRVARWRARVAGVTGTRGLIGLALAVGVLEVASMLPFFGAMALIAASGLDMGARLAVLALYCVLMVAPALVLVIARRAASARVEAGLAWFVAELDRAGGAGARRGMVVLGAGLAVVAAYLLSGS